MKQCFVRVCIAFVMTFMGLSSAYAGFLKFPVYGKTASNIPINSIMDHDRRLNYIKTYTGETGSMWDGCRAYINSQNVACTSANTTAPRGYKKPGGGAWNLGLNYTDYTENYNTYMWYDNHRGYDFGAYQWTPVVAAAEGKIVATSDAYGQITLEHANGYRTVYTHMYRIFPQPLIIQKGAQLGWVSNVSPVPVGIHLHFEVKRNINGIWVNVDPYGGSGQPVLWE